MKYKITLLFSLVLTLTACGGGGSSSGGGNSGVQLFSGTQTIVLSGGGVSASENALFSMEINGNTATITDEDFTISGALSNNAFTISSPQLSIEVDATTTCNGSVTYNGMVSGSSVSGTLSGSFDCGFVTLTVSGNFSATTGNSKININIDSLTQAIRNAVSK